MLQKGLDSKFWYQLYMLKGFSVTSKIIGIALFFTEALIGLSLGDMQACP